MDLVSPRFALLNDTQLQAVANRSRFNIANLALETTDGPKTPSVSAGQLYEQWLNKQNVLARDPDPCFYLYEQAFSQGSIRLTQRGFYALLKLDAQQNDVAMPTKPWRGKRGQRAMQSPSSLQANITPVIALYDDPKEVIEQTLCSLTSAFPDLALTDERGKEHRVFRISNEHQANRISGYFESKPLMLVEGGADAEEALISGRKKRTLQANDTVENAISGWVLAYLVRAEPRSVPLTALHRIVRDRPDFEFASFLRELGQAFELTPLPSLRDHNGIIHTLIAAGKKGLAFVFVGGGAVGRRAVFLAVPKNDVMTEWFEASTEPRVVRELDIGLLDELVFRDILGIDLSSEFGEDKCDFHHDAHIAMQKARSKDLQMVVLSNPIGLPAFWQMIESQRRIPAHGCRFLPDVNNGMVMYDLANI